MPRTQMSRKHLINFSLALFVMVLLSPRVRAVGCAAPSFNVSTFDYNGFGISSVIAADFNDDGKLDLAAAATSPDNGGGTPTLVLLGDGAGNFRPPTAFQGAYRATLATGDFNLDGKLDLVVAAQSYIAILPGNGLGGFLSQAQPFYLSQGGQITSVSVEDFDHDDYPAVVVTTLGISNKVYILRGNGFGSFYSNPLPLPFTGMWPEDTAVGDFNRDGNVDVAVASYGYISIQPAVDIILGDGRGGSLANALTYPVALGQARTVDAGDFNGDGIADLAVAKYSTESPGQIALMFGSGTGSFSGDASMATGNGPAFIAHQDFNLDRGLDLVLTNYNAGGVTIHLGNQVNGYPGSVFNFPLTMPRPASFATGDFNGDARPDIIIGNFGGAYPSFTQMTNTCTAPVLHSANFDGDGRSDISVYRPSNGYWYMLFSSDNSFQAYPWGTGTDKIVPADYDGDGKTDIAIFRPDEGKWYVLQSSNHLVKLQNWGVATDVPVPGDYDGDGKSDFAVFRPQSGSWFILQSSNGAVRLSQWGVSTDSPVPGDYDGDNKTDIAVFRQTTGKWYVFQSSDNITLDPQFGASGDMPVPADYDGDGQTDIAYFRPTNGTWYISSSMSRNTRAQQWGTNGDVPVPTDYDGDGRADLAVFRPSAGSWYVLQSSNNQVRAQQFGQSGDVPIPSALIPH
ncbi:MAG: VCBS repeat-containing protein [Acidobacteria bacterium]|nr:VCBS repeat-containing protein [Acidobacteriota bacterium]